MLIVGSVAIRGWEQYRVGRIAQGIEEGQERDRAIAAADDVGGRTPGETLGMLADALEKGDVAGARALAVPALRDRLGEAVAGRAPDVQAIRTIRQAAASADPRATGRVTITDPAYVELIQYPSGKWKVAAF